MKKFHHHDPMHAETREVIHQIVSIRAYELWEKCGRPENRALDNWLQAERDLVSGRRNRRYFPVHSDLLCE